MTREPLFAGLVVDEYDQPVQIANVGNEPCYVVNDAGFLRHIPCELVDRQVLKIMASMIEGHEEELASQTVKMLGQDDIFTKAIIEHQLKNIEQQLEAVLTTGIPDEGRAYMGMMGFKVRINIHGDVLEVHQPGAIAPDDGES
jgi:hypothetical protein